MKKEDLTPRIQRLIVCATLALIALVAAGYLSHKHRMHDAHPPLAFDEAVALLDGPLPDMTGYLENLEKVTPADVQRAAQTYLRPQNRVIGIYQPNHKGINQ